MTADKVIDASAICAIIFNEPDEAKARTMMAGAADIYAPALIDFEIANAALKKIRARPDDADDILRLHANYQSYTITMPEIDFPAAIRLAYRETLSIYDATYLWLALEMNIDLVTLDDKLGKAYRRLVP